MGNRETALRNLEKANEKLQNSPELRAKALQNATNAAAIANRKKGWLARAINAALTDADIEEIVAKMIENSKKGDIITIDKLADFVGEKNAVHTIIDVGGDTLQAVGAMDMAAKLAALQAVGADVSALGLPSADAAGGESGDISGAD